MSSVGIWVCLIAAAAVATSPVMGQVRRTSDHSTEDFEFEVLSQTGMVELPFKVVNNHILIPVSVNGSEPFEVILDTGMPVGGLILYGSQRVDDLGLEFGSIQARVGGAGGSGEHKAARVAPDATLSLPDLKIREAQVIVLPTMPEFFSYHEGIIGAALFRNFVVEIDYEKNMIHLQDSKTFQAPEGVRELPLTFRHGVAYVQGEVKTRAGETVPVELVVDTGGSHPLSLNTDSNAAIQVPEGAIRTAIGHGVGGKVLGHVGRVASLNLGGLTLLDVVTTFPISEHQSPGRMDSRNGNLGSGAMRRFNITFDYARSRMLLKPNDHFEEPFEFDMSGMQLWGRSEGGLVISEILSNSPAAEAGLRADDVVTEIDGRPVSEIGLFEVREMMKREGAQVRVEFKRSTKPMEALLVLRRLV